jgi:predicted MFS family arabinose efflux permease
MLCPITILALLVIGKLHIWIVIALSLVVGITDALSMPAFASIVPFIVRRDDIGAGLALNSVQFSLSRIMGPALAGVLLATAGAIGCFAASAISYLPLILVTVWLLPRGAILAPDSEPFDHHHPFRGIRTIIGVPVLRGALLTTFFSSALCGPLLTFAPVLVKTVFRLDATHFSLTVGAFGVGGVTGAAGLLAVSATHDRRYLSARFASLCGLVIVLASLAPRFSALVALLMAAGMATSISNTSSNTLLQSLTPSHLRGQAASTYMLALRGGIAIGSLTTGLLATALGIRDALIVNGILAIGVQAAINRHWLREPIGIPEDR